MKIQWRLRMAAAERGVWTATQLRRLLADEAGYPLSAPSVGALLTGEPNQVRLSTLLALCTALRCTPNDLFALDFSVDEDAPPDDARPAASGAPAVHRTATPLNRRPPPAIRRPAGRPDQPRVARVPVGAAPPGAATARP